MVKVSVILPCYNVATYLPKCLDSLSAQTLPNIEIICVNDASTDNTLDILERYAAEDNRIKIINQPNAGPGKARNNGILKAVGEYTAFVDPDDWVEHNMFEKMYDAAIQNNADLVECALIAHEEKNGKTNLKLNLYPQSEQPFFTLKDNPDRLFCGTTSCWNKLYKTCMLKQNNILFSEGFCSEDLIFMVGAKIFANKIVYINEALYHYLQRTSSITHKKSKNNIDVPIFLGDTANLLKRTDFFEKVQDNFASHSALLAAVHYRKLPDELTEKYRELCRQHLVPKAFKLFNSYAQRTNFRNKIFSIHFNGKVWVFTLLGIRMKFKKFR